MTQEKVFAMPFAKIYDCYVQKAIRKQRTQQEVDTILRWITGYEELPMDVTLSSFFTDAPQLNPRLEEVTGTVCGIRVELVEDPIMRLIRRTDKLIDELAKGKSMEKILR